MIKIKDKQLLSYLHKIKAFEQSGKSLEEGKYLIFKELNYACFIIRTYHEFNKYPFFRARSLTLNENPTSIRSYSYPPAEYNKLGRANLKSSPVLYATDDPVTAIREFLNNGQATDFVYLAEWKLQDNRSISTLPIMAYPYSDKNINKEPFTNFTSNTKEILTEIFETLISLFKKTNEYSFTAPFSHHLLYNLHACEMIIYPSVITNGKSTCYAINKDFFDSYFSLKRVYKIYVEDKIALAELERNPNQYVPIRLISAGYVVDNKLVFKELTEKDMEFWDYYSLIIDETGVLSFKNSNRPF